MPQLMDMLELKGTIITADAMNTQKATAKKAIDNEADYILLSVESRTFRSLQSPGVKRSKLRPYY